MMSEQSEALKLMLEAYRQSPEQRDLYPVPSSKQSLPDLLAAEKRYQEATEVIEQGIALYPKDYYLYERLWQSWFAEPKSDYDAEKRRVREQAEALFAGNPPSPGLLKTVSNGFRMAGEQASMEMLEQQLLADFPLSIEAQHLRFREVSSTKDLREKARLWDQFNRDFPSLYPLQHTEYFDLLYQIDASDEELRKAAQAALDDARDRGYGSTFLTLKSIAEAFVSRNIYLDDLQTWLDEAQSDPGEVLRGDKVNMSDAVIFSARGKMMAAQGQAREAEKMLRRVGDMAADQVGVVRADVKQSLADVLSRQGRKEEALELYARAVIDAGQGYGRAAEKKFRALHQELKGTEEGADEYLSRLKGDSAPAPEHMVELNRPAPDFDLVRVGGGRVRLSEFRGRAVVLNFWATWCGPCQKELPHLQAYFEEKQADPEVALLTINIDKERALVEPFVKEREFTFPVLLDEDVASKVGVPPVPTIFIIDPAGNMRLRIIGLIKGNDIGATLDRLLAKYGDISAAPAPTLDTIPAEESDPVVWSLQPETPDAQLKPGDNFDVLLTAEIAAGWHLYSTEQTPGGPLPTRITLAEEHCFKLAGEIKEPQPQVEFDPSFDLETQYFVGRTSFRLPMAVTEEAPNGAQEVKIKVRYQMCSGTICYPPKEEQLSLEVNITA